MLSDRVLSEGRTAFHIHMLGALLIIWLFWGAGIILLARAGRSWVNVLIIPLALTLLVVAVRHIPIFKVTDTGVLAAVALLHGVIVLRWLSELPGLLRYLKQRGKDS